jgi:hypothetical protein
MGYTPEQLTRRRQARARSRKRRLLATATLVLVLCAAGAGADLLKRNHHHVVIVLRAAAPHQTPSPPAAHTQAEYPAAPGAPSLKHVRSQLAATTKHKRADSAAAANGAAGGVLAADAASSFAELARTLPGRIELAVTPLGAGPREVLGSDEPAHGWSTTKVPVLVSLLRARGAEGLTAQERQWAQSAITESNNESVLALFGDLERLENGLDGASQYIEDVLRTSGDNETVVATAPPPAGAVTTFGQTEWRPGEAVKFFRALALGCLLPASQTSYVLNLMEHIEPSESWGLGSAGFSSIAFKGGWGPESSGYLVRQSGIIDPGSSSGAVAAIVAFAPSFPAGTEMLTTTATWLNQHLVLSARQSTGCNAE